VDIKQIILALPAAKLKKAVVLKERIEALQRELQDLIIEVSPTPVKQVLQGHKKMSAAARKKISATLKALGKSPSGQEQGKLTNWVGAIGAAFVAAVAEVRPASIMSMLVSTEASLAEKSHTRG